MEGWEGASVGSGVCRNLMCWRLRGKGQVLGEELELEFVPFLPPGLLLPCPLFLWSFCLPLSLHFLAFSYVLGVLGERGGSSIL